VTGLHWPAGLDEQIPVPRELRATATLRIASRTVAIGSLAVVMTRKTQRWQLEITWCSRWPKTGWVPDT